MRKQRHGSLKHVVRGLLKVVAVVLIWRGIWVGLDAFDLEVFGGNHAWSAMGGAVIGFLILYLPDRDIREVIP